MSVARSDIVSIRRDTTSRPDKHCCYCRELEMSPQVNHRQIARVLAGAGSYDALGEQEQAIVREAWAERMAALRGELNYAARFESAGESYSEVDDDGKLVVHPTHG